MKMIPDGDWACFIDGDAMFLHSDFGHKLEAVIKDNPDCELFSCVTNRVATDYQLRPGLYETDNIRRHKQEANINWTCFKTRCSDITNHSPISGVLILLSKSQWLKAGGFKEDGILGVDNSIHYRVRDTGGKVKLIEGFYVYHWYRGGIRKNKQHLL
jgi:GT2 family glycosyltransferase